jgi:hypothetical protein
LGRIYGLAGEVLGRQRVPVARACEECVVRPLRVDALGPVEIHCVRRHDELADLALFARCELHVDRHLHALSLLRRRQIDGVAAFRD